MTTTNMESAREITAEELGLIAGGGFIAGTENNANYPVPEPRLAPSPYPPIPGPGDGPFNPQPWQMTKA